MSTATAPFWTRPSTKSWKSRTLRKSNEPRQRSKVRSQKSEVESRESRVECWKTGNKEGSLHHDRRLPRRGQNDVGGATCATPDRSRVARRPHHERSGQRIGRYDDAAVTRVCDRRNSRRLFLLPLQLAGGR